MKNKSLERVGEIRIMNDGHKAEIIEYFKHSDIKVKILDTGEIIETNYAIFKKGLIKSHYSPTLYGVGISGCGETTDSNGNLLKSYMCWNNMMERCYSNKFQIKHPSYADCKVCEEWKYYLNFKKWYEENYYEIEGQIMHLDKDILAKGNKIYSPETCCFVPSEINVMFTKSDKSRGKYPIGVTFIKKGIKNYQARLCTLDEDNKKRRISLGVFLTPEEAFYTYKIAKEKYVKEKADKFKELIPSKLYNAMYLWEVDIND